MDKRHVIFSNYDDIKNPYYGGGGAFSIHEVAKRLVHRHNFRVTVLTGKYPACRNEIMDGVEYVRIGVSLFGPKFGQLLYHFFLIWNIMTRSFDVWIESFTPPFSTSFTPIFTRKPVIGLVHMLSGEDMKRKYKIPFHMIEHFGLKFYTRCIVLSEYFCTKLQRINRHMQIAVIPNGVDIQSFQTDRPEPKHILCIGRIEVSQKGLDLLLKSYSMVAHVIRLPLVIAGSGSANEVQKLKQLIRKFHLEEKVILLGKVLGTEAKKKLFSEAQMLILSARFETFSLVALESMASGTPLITFDINGLKWISSDVVIKVSPFNTKRFSEAILNVYNNVEMRKQMSRNGTAFVKSYDWDISAEAYQKIILSAIRT